MSYTVRIPAKLNLSLAIVGKRGDMHLIDSVAYPYEGLSDEVTIIPNASENLTVGDISGSFAGLDKDRFIGFLSPKLKLIASFFHIGGVINIEKNIPLGGGLGGSSAVLAGTVKCTEALTGTKPSSSLLISLGSDVPAMYFGGAVRIRGVGEDISPIPSRPLHITLKFVGSGCDSGECYRLYDELLAEGKLPSPPSVPTTIDEAILLKRNDLAIPAKMLCPDISAAMDEIEKTHGNSMLTGSGSTVFAIDI